MTVRIQFYRPSLLFLSQRINLSTMLSKHLHFSESYYVLAGMGWDPIGPGWVTAGLDWMPAGLD